MKATKTLAAALLATCSLCAYGQASDQTYSGLDLLKEGTEWEFLTDTYGCEPDSHSQSRSYYKLIEGPEFEGMKYLEYAHYYKGEKRDWYATVYVRTENGKVWFRDDENKEDKLLYDFNIVKGDKLVTHDPNRPTSFIDMECTNVSEITNCGTVYKLYDMTYSERTDDENYQSPTLETQWLEGLGNVEGLDIYMISITGGARHNSLYQVKSDGKVIYEDNRYAPAGVAGVAADDKEGTHYNIFGLPVPADAKGIYICNGKKYINR